MRKFAMRTALTFLAAFLTIITHVQVRAQKSAPGRVSNAPKSRALKVIGQHQGPVIAAEHPDVVAAGIKSGFETGQVVKVGNQYHMFVNEMLERPHRDMRIAHWQSSDLTSWNRKSTIVNSIAGRTPDNPRSEVWVTGVVFNETENAWNIFYVAYRAGDESKGEIAGNDYAGRIWRAMSVKRGMEGIGGPYADMGIVLQPDQNSQLWEGQQAVACFNPYLVGDTWFTMYDGHNHVPRGNWPTGMAFSKNLEGPWTRMPVGINPLPIASEFMENEIVTKLSDGRYLLIFDSLGDQQVGYSISDDGINFDKEKRLNVQSGSNLWAQAGDHSMRTPLCALENPDGTFTMIYTARMLVNGKPFYAVGQCQLAWEEK